MTSLAVGGVLDPTNLLETFGFAGLLAVVFAETGLLIGFFLPGDSLLFTAGLFTARSEEPRLDLPILLVMGAVTVAAIVGAQVGYLIGRGAGDVLFDRPDSRLFKRVYVEKAERYFERFGPGKAVVLARFIPIVRTFLNPVAGVLEMPIKQFTLWNVVGGVLWGCGVTLLGYVLGETVPGVDRYLLPAIAIIIVVSLLPIVFEVVKHRRDRVRPSS